MVDLQYIFVELHVFFTIEDISFVPNVLEILLNLLPMGSHSQRRKLNYQNPEQTEVRFPKSPLKMERAKWQGPGSNF